MQKGCGDGANCNDTKAFLSCFICMSNPIPTLFLTPIDGSRIPAEISLIVLTVRGKEAAVPSYRILIANTVYSTLHFCSKVRKVYCVVLKNSSNFTGIVRMYLFCIFCFTSVGGQYFERRQTLDWPLTV